MLAIFLHDEQAETAPTKNLPKVSLFSTSWSLQGGEWFLDSLVALFMVLS
jgi:hypothetical protein